MIGSHTGIRICGRAVLVLATIVTITEGHRVLAQSAYPATAEMLSNGVATYTKEAVPGSGVTVALYDASSSLVGSAIVTNTETGGMLADWTGSAGEHIHLLRNGAGDAYQLINVPSGQTGSISRNYQANGWLVSSIALLIIAEHQVAVQRTACALAAGSPAETAWMANPSPPALAGPEPECHNLGCRGTAVSDTRSWCCREANSRLQGCCSNAACWGCCETLGCDATCALGDYFCFCGQSGLSCTGINGGPPSTFDLIFSSPAAP
jgi:hypothetical protein